MNNPKQDLENLAKLQQMKINARLVSVETSLKLMHHANYTAKAGNEIDAVTLLAQAGMIEGYILGNIEKETTEALEEAAKRLGAPRIVRP